MKGRAKEWVCLMVDGLSRDRDAASVEREVSSAFGEDALELRSVCTEGMASSTGEYYLFVRCKEYHSHLERLTRSSAVVSAVPSFENPHWFGTAEVEAFEGSACRKERPGRLDRGDMVLVKDGYLKGLYGVVAGRADGRRYKVVFSFYLRRFSENMSVTALGFVGNVLRRVAERRETGVREAAVRHHLRGQKSGDAEGRPGRGQ